MENFVNDYSTTLNGAITNVATSIVVTSATGAPAANFRIRIDDEYMLVTAVAGTTYTVTRGIEGSTAVGHSNLAPVNHVITKAGLDQFLLERVETNPGQTDQTLTDGVTISWDTSLGGIATITLGGNRTMAAPTNLKKGTYVLHVLQDATGSRTITWNAVFKWASGTAPTLSTAASKHDIITFVCDGTNLYGVAALAFA